MEMLSNCSTSSITSFALLILMTMAACPWSRRAKRNLRRAVLISCGISTVWDCLAFSDLGAHVAHDEHSPWLMKKLRWIDCGGDGNVRSLMSVTAKVTGKGQR